MLKGTQGTSENVEPEKEAEATLDADILAGLGE